MSYLLDLCLLHPDISNDELISAWAETLISRGITIRSDLTSGDHVLRCEVLQATADPGGGTEFRIISVMRYVLSPNRYRYGG
jgi:hypothetical protein